MKVLSPEILHIKEADSFHILEGGKSEFVKTRIHFLFRGLSPRYEINQEVIGTWEILLIFQKWKAANNSKRKECGDRQQEVGLIRSKGVVGVIPSAGKVAHLKGSAIV